MSKLSLGTNLTDPTVLMSDLSMIDCEDGSPWSNPAGSLSNGSSSCSSSSISCRSLANAIANANAKSSGSLGSSDEKGSIETPYNQTPYVVDNRRGHSLEPYVQQSSVKPRSIPKKSKTIPKRTNNKRRESQRIPKVTSASIPFEKTIPPTSFLRDELAKDPAYRHALKAGTLWQSLIAQHVKLPALWYDGQEPARPYLGCEDPLKRNKWSYFGRHRVAGDPKLNTLVRDSGSSGKLLLHIICKDSETFEPTEDIVVGVFHPNAEGIREKNSPTNHQRFEDCRDVFIGHRSRRTAQHGQRVATQIESLLRYLHKNKVDKSPLGNSEDGKGPRSKRTIDNTSMNTVFGSRAPRHTIFVPEGTLHDLLLPRSKASSPPASVVLLRTFLR